MKIGLLLCDHVSEEFHHIITDYPVAFESFLMRHIPDLSLTVYDVCHGGLPGQIDACDAYVISGSRYGVYDDLPWIESLAEFVRRLAQAERKVIGICFGHQMIAHALGGRVEKSERGWGVGVKTVKVNRPQSWMQPQQTAYNLLHSHQDQVIEPPPGAEVLGGSDHFPISMYIVGQYLLGIQAHPEFSKPYAEALLDVRTDRIGAATADAAMASLELPTDEDVVGEWVRAFLVTIH